MKTALLALVLLGCASTSKTAAKPIPAPETAAPAASAPVPAAPPVAARPPPEPPPMQDAPYRQQRPAPLAVQPRFIAPVPMLRKLRNGARLLVVENHALPLIAVDVVFLSGTDKEPIEKSGLAEFVADTVDEGTASRTATQLAEQIEDLAALISAGAGRESSSVHLDCLSETLPQALELLADIVQHPAFRAPDVERVRTLRLTQLQQKNASPGALAADQAARILFGEKHPWGQPAGGTPETIGAITPADLAKFHQTWWVPNNAVISVSGDVTAAQMQKLLEERFAQWKPRALPKVALPAVPELSPGIVALDKQGTTQSQVWVLGRMFPAKNPDALAMRLANTVLGGIFTSRLNMNLREKNAYSYGVGSGLSLQRNQGTFRAAGGVIAKHTVDAVREYENELRRFSDGTVSDDELAKAKDAFVRGLPSALETNNAVAGALAGLYSLGLPLDYYKTLPSRVGRIGKPEIARVVKKWVHPERWPLVIVGPVAQSEDALRKLALGPVELKPAPGSRSPRRSGDAGAAPSASRTAPAVGSPAPAAPVAPSTAADQPPKEAAPRAPAAGPQSAPSAATPPPPK
jgi:zinc protease